MAKRITIRLDDAAYGRLADAAKARGVDVSSVIRQAVMADLDERRGTTPTTLPPHARETCAEAILAGCPYAVQHEISTRLTRVDLPLVNVLKALLSLSVAPFVDQAEQQGVELPTLLHQALVMWLDRASRARNPAASPRSPEE